MTVDEHHGSELNLQNYATAHRLAGAPLIDGIRDGG